MLLTISCSESENPVAPVVATLCRAYTPLVYLSLPYLKEIHTKYQMLLYFVNNACITTTYNGHIQRWFQVRVYIFNLKNVCCHQYTV